MCYNKQDMPQPDYNQCTPEEKGNDNDSSASRPQFLLHIVAEGEQGFTVKKFKHFECQSSDLEAEMGLPHALILPYPAQGHVIPLMELSHRLVDHGFKITFVNTEFNHNRVLAALSQKNGSETDQIHLVSIPDGLGPSDDRNELGRLTEAFLAVMPRCLEEIIQKSNQPGEVKITCMIADESMAWAFDIAKKMGIRSAAFWPAAAGILATMLSIPKLIEDGIINTDGLPKQQGNFQLSPGMPSMSTAHLVWNCLLDSKTQQIAYQYILNNNRATEIAEFIICNTFHELELPVLTFAPNIVPVGPLLTGQRLGKLIGHFWQEDLTCITWLDKQPSNSVIYVAFGSFTIFDKCQFQELALGLELSGRPFLWVVRPDLTDGTTDAYPNGFRTRIAGRGKLVGWSPQQKVLSHPSIACFLSHCGWNSTMEGVRNGVPFLCWPYFADQFLNQSYICDVWKTGLRMIPNEAGIISKEQIKSKVKELIGDQDMKARAIMWKEMANKNVAKGGSSYENFNTFADAMK